MAVIEEDNDPLKTDVIRILDRYDNQYDRLVELLTGMLASREQWMTHLLDARRGDGFDRQGMEAALRYLVETQLEIAREATPESLLSELPRFYHYAIGNGADNSDALKALLDACGGANCAFLDLPTSADALGHWKTMIGGLLTAAGDIRKGAPNANDGFPAPSSAKGEDKARFAAFKEDFKALLDAHRDNDTLRNIYNTISGLPNPVYEDEAWESLESLMRILLRAAENWKLVMAETGEVDFSEIAHRAIESLGYEGAPSDLALRMDYRIQHLLVDEFQDTSASQIRLLKQLTTGWSDGDGRTLFLVGDPMQSIYRFRKAEVSLFIEAWDGHLFDHILLRPLQLTVNFRSTKPIVDWVNQIFPMVMPSKNDPVMGAVSYSEAATKPAVSERGRVAIQILPERDDEEEARLIVEIIRQSDADESIAILVRSRSHVSSILAALDKLKPEQRPLSLPGHQVYTPGRYNPDPGPRFPDSGTDPTRRPPRVAGHATRSVYRSRPGRSRCAGGGRGRQYYRRCDRCGCQKRTQQRAFRNRCTTTATNRTRFASGHQPAGPAIGQIAGRIHLDRTGWSGLRRKCQ